MALQKSPNDDYFAETTMSFGQHLEELRIAFFRSLVTLIIFVAMRANVVFPGHGNILRWVIYRPPNVGYFSKGSVPVVVFVKQSKTRFEFHDHCYDNDND